MTGVASLIFLVIGLWWQPIPRWAVFLAAAICYVIASFRVWQREHKIALQDGDRRLLRELKILIEGFFEIMRRFPQSESVRFPLSIRWRPSVGTTNIPADQQEVIRWTKRCHVFLDLLDNIHGKEPDIKELTVLKYVPFSDGCSSLECLRSLYEIESFLLKNVLLVDSKYSS